jgi:hypothetical protein
MIPSNRILPPPVEDDKTFGQTFDLSKKIGGLPYGRTRNDTCSERKSVDSDADATLYS